jgi:DNA adenine methylase
MPNNVFPYPGNKARHSDWILQHIPEHHCYVEPFGGAAGVLFNKPQSNIEIYNDVDGDIVHFFEVLRERPDALTNWLERVPFSRELFDEWADDFYSGYRPEDDIKRAGRFFALRYMQWGGVYYSKKGFATKPTRDNGAVTFQNKVSALSEFADRLKEVIIEDLDWTEIINRYDREHTVFYCDPPYPDDENEGYYGLDGFDQKRFYEVMCGIDGKALISLDRIPPYYDENWSVVAKDSNFSINGKKDENKDATEYLIMNYDSDGEPIMSNVGQQTLKDIDA